MHHDRALLLAGVVAVGDVETLRQIEIDLDGRALPLPAERVYQDNGQSGARLDRPALDRLRDAVASGAIDVVLITSPDRLARLRLRRLPGGLSLESWARADPVAGADCGGDD